MLVLWKTLVVLLQVSASLLLLTEERQVVSNAGGLQNLQYLQSLLNSAGGSSLMVSWMMLQDP